MQSSSITSPTKQELSGAVGMDHYVSWDFVWFCTGQTEMEFSLNTVLAFERERHVTLWPWGWLTAREGVRSRGYLMLGSGVQDIISCKVQNNLQIMYGYTLANNVKSCVFYLLVAYLRWMERRMVSQSTKKTPKYSIVYISPISHSNKHLFEITMSFALIREGPRWNHPQWKGVLI